MLDFYVKTGIRFSFRDKRLFEITEVEITRVDCRCSIHGDQLRNVKPSLMIKYYSLLEMDLYPTVQVSMDRYFNGMTLLQTDGWNPMDIKKTEM